MNGNEAADCRAQIHRAVRLEPETPSTILAPVQYAAGLRSSRRNYSVADCFTHQEPTSVQRKIENPFHLTSDPTVCIHSAAGLDTRISSSVADSIAQVKHKEKVPAPKIDPVCVRAAAGIRTRQNVSSMADCFTWK